MKTGYIFEPKVPIWVYIGGLWNGKYWYFLWTFGTHMAIWYILWTFGTFCGHLV
jgi:hypothetical protein